MAARYVQKAVDSLHTTINGGIATQLRAVETSEGLTSGALTDPEAVVKARMPLDNRTPLIQVFDESWAHDAEAGQRHDMITTFCNVVLTTFSQDTDLEAAELFMRRYITAMIETIATDPTLGGAAMSAVVTGGDSAAVIGDKSASRLAHVLEVEVRTHTP
tara:strand:- start:97 stop:576 length:480 start_codon:yes stop_codon:yes gene_type:complete